MTLKLSGANTTPDPPRPTSDADRQRGPLSRLLVALILCILLAVFCWVAMPRLGVYMPPIVPLMGFGVIATGTLASLWERRRSDAPRDETNPDDP